MTPDQFSAKYRALVRVALDWDRFAKDGWPISHRVVRAPNEISKCFAPWYIGRHGVEVPFNAADATPVRFGDIPRLLAQLSPAHRLGILTYVELFRHQAGRLEFSAPAYALSDGAFVALDANHRLAAVILVGEPCAVEFDIVDGPHDAYCLADIAAHVRAPPSR